MHNLARQLWTLSPQKIALKMRSVLTHRHAQAEETVTIAAGPLQGVSLEMPQQSKASYTHMCAGSYEPHIMYELQQLNLPGKVVWDIGAHVGYHSLLAAVLVGERGQVVAFEPNHHNIVALQKNLSHNPALAPRVRIVEKAVTDTAGPIIFSQSTDTQGPHTEGGYLAHIAPPLSKESYKGFTATTVEGTTIAQELLSLPPPDVIKIDVEGAELSVLRGGASFIKTHRPILIIEIHTVPMMLYVGRFLDEAGYTYRIIDEGSAVSTKNILASPSL